MPKKNREPMKLTWLSGEPFRCLCTSESVPGFSYMVDVLENACDCEDFNIRHDGVPESYCKHLEFAREDLLNKMLDVFRRSPRITGCQSARSPKPEPESLPDIAGSDAPF